jgi:CheY-like chemotaxis protein
VKIIGQKGVDKKMNEEKIVLLVEDNESHADLIMHIFKGVDEAVTVHWVEDGEQALTYLFHNGVDDPEENSQRPDLVLLDLRMPKIDGHEVLQGMKQSEQLRDIPVVVFTTSESERDMMLAYENHANSYLVKTLDFKKFSKMIADLASYWLVLNRHPWSEKKKAIKLNAETT